MAFVAPPGYQPIYNPSIPYVGPICGGLRAGMSIYIQGKIQHHISSFHVNLQCGEFNGCDIAFHFNPRFDLWDKVVFNTFQNGSWEGEEKVREMPFRKGEHFEIVIAINSEGYQVNVNGREFYLFQHRMPLERVCGLEIGGDVSIDSINIIGVMGLQPVFNPVIPYSGMIPGGMLSKRTIIIRGMVPYGADRFGINFLVGASRDIAFHLNPRIREGVVVRNSQIGGCWGEEERDLNFNPFLEGQYFEISIRCGEEKFKVFANGQHMCHFYHRFQPYNQIDMLQVEGDVQLSYIHF
ncbi:Galectin-4 [Bagarius yarrelli]|uniref:Galectin n=1 Tax=Bagarius yarrelli TaxID=175774 RepID=A0A556U153_BAGYA|nr:Galectin-4 [Bagarius yarrelli]